MTLVGTVNNGAGVGSYVSLYALANPVSGNKNLQVTMSGTCNLHVGIAAFTGVNQTGGTTSFPHFTSNTNVATLAITSAIGNMVVCGGCARLTAYTGSSGTNIGFDNAGITDAYFLYDAGAATATEGGLGNNSNLSVNIAGFDILAAAGGGSTAFGNMAMMGVGHHKGLGWTPLLDRRSRVFRQRHKGK